uniref:Uncharacterized protein n=1 Tax=viral metagenome TaxID=1070528 RepID=A0A6C0H6I1_9ZZZZ
MEEYENMIMKLKKENKELKNKINEKDEIIKRVLIEIQNISAKIKKIEKK